MSLSLICHIENMLQNEFIDTPFHNLFYLGFHQRNDKYLGGTCSDKTLAFKAKLLKEGIETELHTAHIQGQETHRLLTIKVNGVEYFIDAGNAWPAVKLFPSAKEFTYTAYGITFKAQPRKGFLDISQIKNNQTSPYLEIPLAKKSEQEIHTDIRERFDGKTNYPFATGIRFAKIVNDEFIFLKNKQIRFFHSQRTERKIELSNQTSIFEAIEHYFQVDLKQYGVYDSSRSSLNE